MRHFYKILFNGYIEDDSNIHFKYDYSSIKDIKLSFSDGQAFIEFSMLTKKTLDDFLSFNVRPFKDAYSKIYMLHILLFGRGITIESIEFILDNDHYNLDSTYDKFPLMYSMLKNEHIKISDSWKSIAESYSKATKSSISNDYRYTALYAFLLSQSREFEFDRFQNLWTAMNATYSYVAKCYEESLKMRFGAENEQVLKKLAMVGNDQKSLGALAYIVGGDYKRISAKDSQELLREYYGIERVLGEINEKDFPEFYDECEKNIDKKSVSNSNYYNQLEKIAVKFEVPVYVLLIL